MIHFPNSDCDTRKPPEDVHAGLLHFTITSLFIPHAGEPQCWGLARSCPTVQHWIQHLSRVVTVGEALSPSHCREHSGLCRTFPGRRDQMSSVNLKAFTEGSLGLTDTLEISDVQKVAQSQDGMLCVIFSFKKRELGKEK